MPFFSSKDDVAADDNCAAAVALSRTGAGVGADGPASERVAEGSASGERAGAGLEAATWEGADLKEQAVREELAWVDAT